MTTRKRWKTVSWPGAVQKRHTSCAAAYRWISGQVDQRAAGMLRTESIVVSVDEGTGWQTYERLRLDSLVDYRKATP